MKKDENKVSLTWGVRFVGVTVPSRVVRFNFLFARLIRTLFGFIRTLLRFIRTLLTFVLGFVRTLSFLRLILFHSLLLVLVLSHFLFLPSLLFRSVFFRWGRVLVLLLFCILVDKFEFLADKQTDVVLNTNKQKKKSKFNIVKLNFYKEQKSCNKWEM